MDIVSVIVVSPYPVNIEHRNFTTQPDTLAIVMDEKDLIGLYRLLIHSKLFRCS